MATYKQMVAGLSDDFKARDIARLVYFHCDHFEPWQSFGGRDALDERHAEHIRIFTDELKRIDYARKLTLFYKANINFAYDRDRELIRAADDDLVGFLPRSDSEVAAARTNMKYLAANSAHELQIHIHHEGYTYNTSHTAPDVVEFYKSPHARELDGQRLALAIKLSKEAIRQETDVVFDSWYFVHGHWALNAADDDSCTITNELDLLLRAGCRGDFTFPAGRSHVNPRLEVPYFCRPIQAERAYDLQDADPEFAYGNKAAARSKFFVWASRIKHNRASIDYFSSWVRQNLEQPEEWARDVINQSFTVDHTLFFKTHGHSMFPYYREAKRVPVFPHAHPGVQTVFSLVFDAAVSAGVEIEFATVSEVYERFVAAAYVPASGYALKIAGPAPKLQRPASAEAGRVPRPPSLTLDLGLGPAVLPRMSDRKSSDYSTSAPLSEHAAPPPVAQPESKPVPLTIEDAVKSVSRIAKRAISPAEIRIAQIVAQLPQFQAYHEVGSELIALPLLLSLMGRDTVGIAVDPSQRTAAIEAYDAFSREHPMHARHCELIFDGFPDAVLHRDVSRSPGHRHPSRDTNVE